MAQVSSVNSDSSSEIDEYINKKSVMLQDTLSQRELLLSNRKAENKEVEFEATVTLEENIVDVSFFTFSGTLYFRMGRKIHKIIYSKGNLALKQLGQLSQFPDGEQVLFTKTIEFEGRVMILTRFEVGEAHIYGLIEDDPFFIQALSFPHSRDAGFFVHNANLYLIVVSNEGDNLAATSLYKWLGSHFDEIQTIFTTGAIKVTTFSSQTSEIIIILRQLPNRTVFSEVFEFRDDVMKKTQIIETDYPIKADVYSSDNKTHVIIHDQTKNIIYQWNGFRLTEINHFETQNGVTLSQISTVNRKSFLYMFSDVTMSVYSLSTRRKTIEVGQLNLSTFSRVLDLRNYVDGINILSFIVGLSQDDEMTMSLLLTRVNSSGYSESEVSPGGSEVLRQCFNILELKLYDFRNTVADTISNLRNFIRSYTDRTENVIDGVLSESLTVNSTAVLEISQMKDRLKYITSFLSAYMSPNGSSIVVNSSLVVKGEIICTRMNAGNINIKSLNKLQFTPEQWLRYRKPQTITGPVKLEHAVTNHLEISADDSLLKDIVLQSEGKLVFSQEILLDNLIAEKIYTEKINDIPVNNIHLRSSQQPIKGVKTFENLEADEIEIKSLNGEQPHEILSILSRNKLRNTNFDLNVQINNLQVKTINNINWDEFKDSVFRIGSSTSLTGPLHFSKVKTEHLLIKKLNEQAVEDFLTRTTNQTIKSNMLFNRIFAHNIIANIVNDIKFSDSAVFFGTKYSIGIMLILAIAFKDEVRICSVPEYVVDIIALSEKEKKKGNQHIVNFEMDNEAGRFENKGPVIIDKLNVENDLELTGNVDNSLFLKNGNRMLGTNESDLLQQYEGTVKIKGNLYLNNLNLQPGAGIFLNGTEIETDVRNFYWTKSTNQQIPTHVIIQGLNIPHVLTNTLNGVKFSQYMINADIDTLETEYHFEKVTVNGNVLLQNNKIHKPDLDKLVKEAIRTKGSYIINGQKTYLDKLRTEHLVTPKLEGINTLDVLNTRWPSNVTGTKTFGNIVVEGNMNSRIDHLGLLNDVNVDNFKYDIIDINQEQLINTMNFKNLNVTNLLVEKINGHRIEDYMNAMEELKSLNELENLILDGNITIDNIINISKVNDIPLEKLMDKALKKGDHGGFEGNVRFSKKVKIGNLATLYINNHNMRNITRRLLLKNLNQTITVPYSFGNLKAGNIITPKINNKSVANLIDVSSKRPQKIQASGGLSFSSNVTVRSLEAEKITPCDMKMIAEELSDPSSRQWSRVRILGNVTLLDDHSTLYRIFEKSVRMSTPNTIHAPVKFSNHISVEKITLDKLINNVNISEAIEDAVLIESETEQIITGRKWFSSLQTKKAIVTKNANISAINGENIRSFNGDIVDKNTIDQIVIRGKKTFFGGLQSNKVNTKSLDLENIVDLDNLKKIPSAIFDFLDIDNDLNVSYINEMDFNNVLSNRLLCKSNDNQSADGIYYFEDISVNDLTTPTINGIKIDDIVFDLGIQNITGPKRFYQNVEVFGDIDAELINGMKIQEEFNKSILLTKTTNINGSIVVLRPSHINGNIKTETINGFPLSIIQEILNETYTSVGSLEVHHYLEKIIDKIQRNIPIIQGLPRDFMYLEKSDELQISLPNTVSASIISSKGYILLHVTGEESSGEHCGLPSYCECPVQYALEISPERSVTTFPNKGSQRIFSYDDESMIVHFITNSVSTSANCSTDKSKLMNEVSMMTWNTISTENSTGEFYQYKNFFTGYISRVVYFTLNGITYALVGRYYDPVLGSYDLDCTMIRFNKDRTHATEAQKIPTRGLSELYVFHTAQGVVLVMGNTKSSQNQDGGGETQIYRFNPDNEKFEFLRLIPSFDCSEVTGVVLSTDSFIILAHRIASAQVLKYLPEYDNYYFYQNFDLDEPVIGISSFYAGDYGISDAYLAIVTGTDKYYIYSFQFLEGWKLISSGELEGIRNLIPFEVEQQSYLFAPSTKTSSLLTVVKSGSN